jgi:hypothetical protein
MWKVFVFWAKAHIWLARSGVFDIVPLLEALLVKMWHLNCSTWTSIWLCVVALDPWRGVLCGNDDRGEWSALHSPPPFVAPRWNQIRLHAPLQPAVVVSLGDHGAIFVEIDNSMVVNIEVRFFGSRCDIWWWFCIGQFRWAALRVKVVCVGDHVGRWGFCLFLIKVSSFFFNKVRRWKAPNIYSTHRQCTTCITRPVKSICWTAIRIGQIISLWAEFVQLLIG